MVCKVFDMASSLNHIHDDQSTTNSVSLDPVFSHKHGSEGFALDWSRVKQGLLASGTVDKFIKEWSFGCCI